MKAKFLAWIILAMLSLAPALQPAANAQCPMCKAAVEAGSNNGKGEGGKGSPLASNLNLGILYLFVLPYGAIMLVAFVVYRSYRAKKKESERQQMVTLESIPGLQNPPQQT